MKKLLVIFSCMVFLGSMQSRAEKLGHPTTKDKAIVLTKKAMPSDSSYQINLGVGQSVLVSGPAYLSANGQMKIDGSPVGLGPVPISDGIHSVANDDINAIVVVIEPKGYDIRK